MAYHQLTMVNRIPILIPVTFNFLSFDTTLQAEPKVTRNKRHKLLFTTNADRGLTLKKSAIQRSIDINGEN